MSENDRRVNRATIAIHAYYSQDPSGDDRRTVLVDLLSDLHHYARAHGINFDDALTSATSHYLVEAGFIAEEGC